MTIKKKKSVSTATMLARHVKQTSKEVRAEWPKWKQVLFMPRKPRNGFKT
ncbi:MAG: hypothetical protein GY845_29115 [Planctomycetes bacterium]|nr:hypothetical protein [Planctomycetota bacterium]